MIADLSALGHRLAAAPDLWLAVAGSALTAILAAFAAFQLSLPDARRAWALLPLPATLLWIVASSFGCLRVWFVPGTHAADLSEAAEAARDDPQQRRRHWQQSPRAASIRQAKLERSKGG